MTTLLNYLITVDTISDIMVKHKIRAIHVWQIYVIRVI